jgi:hypothetical protein
MLDIPCDDRVLMQIVHPPLSQVFPPNTRSHNSGGVTCDQHEAGKRIELLPWVQGTVTSDSPDPAPMPERSEHLQQ